jgi:hypothetical protein
MSTQHYARVIEDKAVEVYTPPFIDDQGTQAAIEDCFHADIAAQFRECPEGTLVGSTVDEQGNWTPPPPVEEPEPQPNPVPVGGRKITRLAFRNRFTQAEKVTLELASLDDPAAPMQQRQQAAALRASMKDQENATYIDLDRADTRAGVMALELGGLIASGRALQILDAPIADEEHYRG